MRSFRTWRAELELTRPVWAYLGWRTPVPWLAALTLRARSPLSPLQQLRRANFTRARGRL